MGLPERRVDIPTTPHASWRPALLAAQDAEEVTARIPDVARMLAISIGGEGDLPADAGDSGRALVAPPVTPPPESGIVARAPSQDFVEPVPALPAVTLLPPPVPEVVVIAAPARRRRASRATATGLLAAFALLLVFVAGLKPDVLAARAPRTTVTRLESLLAWRATKAKPTPAPAVVVVVAPPPQRVAPRRFAAPTPPPAAVRALAPRPGIVRVAPF
jgi:hypothetical protein